MRPDSQTARTGTVKLYLLAALVGLALPAQAIAGSWTAKNSPNLPDSRYAHAMAYDVMHGQVVLFGGSSLNGLANDTWVWNGGYWLKKSPAHSPSARAYHAMAYDAASGQVVLFGGTNSAQELGDTWVWNGSDWAAVIFLPVAPHARFNHAMASDAAHGRVVLFGGTYSGIGGSVVQLNDTWVWNGSSWTVMNPFSKPGVRQCHAMAEAAQGQVLLFGGVGCCGKLSDTWVWDGSNWIAKSPAHHPSARYWFAMAFDATSEVVVLFGGLPWSAPGQGQVATWFWDGNDWIREIPLPSPQDRFRHSMAYDSAHGQVVLFGGDGKFVGPCNDTWVYQ